MPDLLIRNVPVRIFAVLRERARRHRRSVQAEALEALQRSARPVGEGVVAWLKETRPAGADAEAGVAAILEARKER